MAVVKQGLKGSNSVSNSTRNPTIPNGTSDTLIGKVYGVVTTENTPTPAMFIKAGGYSGMGTVFYLEYNSSKTISGDISDDFLDACSTAKPFDPNTQYYPLLGELVEIKNAPALTSQLTVEKKDTKYWSQIVNLWNNSQLNSQTAVGDEPLGKTFIESPNIKKSLSYEGDYILSGRKGNSIRFGSTVRLFSNSNNPNYNEWSSIGEDGSPITILSNGHFYDSSSAPYVEQINKDDSSIYLTSTQVIPLLPDMSGVLNPLTNPIAVDKYTYPQVIINGDRVVINSKRDEVMLFAKTNIEVNTNNVINLNGGERTHINSPKIYLGPATNGELPDEPALLGLKMMDLISEFISVLSTFSSTAASSVDSMGVPVLSLVSACNQLNAGLNKLQDKLDPSSKNYPASNKTFIS
jgi:hypothetical protein